MNKCNEKRTIDYVNNIINEEIEKGIINTNLGGFIMLTHADLGARLKTARETSGLTQQDVSRMLDISRQKLIKVEQGAAPVDTVLLQKMADLYCYSIDFFFEEESELDNVQIKFAFRADEYLEEDRATIDWAQRVMNNIKNLQEIEKGLD